MLTLSDGEQTIDCDGNCEQAPIDAAAPLKADSIAIFAWGFSGVQRDTLEGIASDPTKVKYSTELSGLRGFVDELKAAACAVVMSPSSPPPPPQLPPQPALPPPSVFNLQLASSFTADQTAVTVFLEPGCTGKSRALKVSDFEGGRHDNGWDACNGQWDDGSSMQYQSARRTWLGSFRVAAGHSISTGTSCHDDNLANIMPR